MRSTEASKTAAEVVHKPSGEQRARNRETIGKKEKLG
jgi:hypothetical protein